MVETIAILGLLTIALCLLWVRWYMNIIVSEEGDKDKTYSLVTKINNIVLNNDDTTNKTTKFKLDKRLKASIIALFLIIVLVSIFIAIVDQSHKIEINTCTYEELTDLYGIGEIRANLIINNRPYHDKTQLLDLLGTELYNNIIDKITVKEES